MIAIESNKEALIELNKTINGNLCENQIIVDETTFSKTDVKRLLLEVSGKTANDYLMKTWEYGTEVVLGFSNGRMEKKAKGTYNTSFDENTDYMVVTESNPFDGHEAAETSAIETAEEVPAEISEPTTADTETENDSEEEIVPEAEEVSIPEAVTETPDAETEEPAEEKIPEQECQKAEAVEETPPPEIIELNLGDIEHKEAMKELNKAVDGKPYGTIVKIQIVNDTKKGNFLSSWSWIACEGKFRFCKRDVKMENNVIHGEYELCEPYAPKEEKPKPFTEEALAHPIPPMRVVPETNFTAEEAAAKLDGELGEFMKVDSDLSWVINQLKERCKEDCDFAQFVMLEQKTVKGAFDYVYHVAKKKECGMTVNFNSHDYGVSLSKEDSIPFFEEYYRYDEEEVARLKKEKEEKEKAEREAKAAAEKKTKKKTSARKKATATDVPKQEAEKPVFAEEPAIEAPEPEVQAEEIKAEPQYPVKEPEPVNNPEPEPEPEAQVKAEVAEPKPVKHDPRSDDTYNQISMFDFLM